MCLSSQKQGVSFENKDIGINEIIQKCQTQKSNVITVAFVLAHTHFYNAHCFMEYGSRDYQTLILKILLLFFAKNKQTQGFIICKKKRTNNPKNLEMAAN